MVPLYNGITSKSILFPKSAKKLTVNIISVEDGSLYTGAIKTQMLPTTKKLSNYLKNVPKFIWSHFSNGYLFINRNRLTN